MKLLSLGTYMLFALLLQARSCTAGPLAFLLPFRKSIYY